MKRIHKFNRNAKRQLAGCMEQPLDVSWKMLHEQQQQEGPSDPPKKTLDEQLTQARSDLATAQASVQSLTTARDTAIQERDTARNEVTNLQSQFDALTQTANASKADVARLTGELSTVTTERDGLKTTVATKDQRIKNLEALCDVKGLDANAAPPAVDQPVAKSTAEFEAEYAAAKTPADRARIVEAMEQAAAARRAAKK